MFVCMYVVCCASFCASMLLSAHTKRLSVFRMRDSFKFFLDKFNTSLSDPNISNERWPWCIILVKSSKAFTYESGVSGGAFQLCVICRAILVWQNSQMDCLWNSIFHRIWLDGLARHTKIFAQSNWILDSLKAEFGR